MIIYGVSSYDTVMTIEKCNQIVRISSNTIRRALTTGICAFGYYSNTKEKIPTKNNTNKKGKQEQIALSTIISCHHRRRRHRHCHPHHNCQ